MLDTSLLSRPFVVRDKTYWASFDDPQEARFLVGFLNSEFARDRIVDWMTRGLFGPRDIHKRVLDVAWPKFDKANSKHVELAALVAQVIEDANSKAAKLAERLTSGRRRAALRASLADNVLMDVERLVAELSQQVVPARA